MTKNITILLIISLVFIACGGDNPRNTVKDFVGAVLVDDSMVIDSLVDWEKMITSRLEEMSPEDSAKSFTYYKNEFFKSLVDNGKRRQNYLNSQIVIGKGDVEGDRAEVELSFIDKTTGIQNYTKVVLVKKTEGWKIIYFY
ncbi:MAG: hypothetical protein GY855_07525 [candidate division Zixibacteria bacterium]|nr:hypothetical protein [candidate division Zixibacteria bacterium]